MTVIELDETVWTPKLVGEELVEAVKWANQATGRVLPAGLRSGFPGLLLTSDERDLEGWPTICEIEDFDPPRQTTRKLSPQKVSQMERILAWPMRYLDRADPGASRVLKVWVRCMVTKGVKFDAVCKQRGWSRATAYRRRDEALAAIAVGLTNDGILRGRH